MDVIMEAIITNLPVDGHDQHDSSAPGGRCRSYVQQEQGGHQQGGAQEDTPPAHISMHMIHIKKDNHFISS